ncbi:hypothetical protein LT679_12920 [Mucilaginibacter roseus]|uniref:DoxX family protein n=1 Tax=Mucilaginibacter roseus TaxID=1528868 RepID=A0ABS8U612_9SPHI|nr:hypothetical protein [Mucilaginibacter roseus]MCD8741510.1 hypothetical protein [Mucilaginibacter roseus]
MMKTLLQFFKKSELYLILVRYALAITMLPYAFTKILRTQFVVTSATLLLPLEQTPGTALTWAFLGHSPWFEVLLGFCELIPALLLLFRRTSFLGAALMLPVTVNVFLINYALELWDATKLIASILLLLNLLIFAIEWCKVKSIIMLILSKTSKLKFSGIEWAVNVLIIAAAYWQFVMPLTDYRNTSNELIGDWLNNHPIEWVQVGETIGDSTISNNNLKLYFGQFGLYTETGGIAAPPNKYKLDASKKTIEFTYQYDNSSFVCNYTLSADILVVERLIDKDNPKRLIRTFVKRVMNLKMARD